jgi:membrane peptidoglycan carboxypeptidase
LVGIIVNGGFRYPSIRIERLHFAQDTPFETNLAYRPRAGERVMRPEVATALRRELIGVVEHGTGRRALGTIVLASGEKVAVGGKTGTGDNRYQVFGPSGRLIESRVINRTATFVFLIGDRFFGTVTAFVPGEAAAEYGFTSSLPVQIFKELAPALSALLAEEPIPDLVAEARSRPLPEPQAESPAALPLR